MRRIIALAIFACAVAVGCSSESDNDERVALADAPALLADATCAAVEACYGTFFDAVLPGEDCRERTKRQLADGLSKTQTAIDAHTVEYDGAEVKACAAALRAAGCGLRAAFVSSACLSALDGTRALGESCNVTQDCAGDAYCKSDGACPGKCTVPGSVGSVCSDDSECQAALACARTNQRCYAPSGEGAECSGDGDRECQPGYACIGADAEQGRMGHCRTLSATFVGKEGAACDLIDGPLCASGTSCVVTRADSSGIVSECRAHVASGAACRLGGPDQCPADEYCAVPASSLTGICTAKPKAGMPCASGPFSSTPNICAPNTRCDAGTCRELQPLDATCSRDDVCLSENCRGGRCVLDGACSTAALSLL